jgi:KaiC/GvpD/RAD55 family RecA-like ATPase
VIDPDTDLMERIDKAEREPARYRHFRPLSDAVDEYEKWSRDVADRIYTGIDTLDVAIRGTAPGELTLIQGHVHSGKTLVATSIIQENHGQPFVVFTPDETRTLILTKLTALEKGVGAEALEEMIQADDTEAHAFLMETAEKYGRLAVYDESVTIRDMEHMMDEATHALGQRPKGVIFDYVELLDGIDDVKAQLSALKRFGKEQRVALFAIHQTSRTAGAGGRKLTINSGAYGGEQQSMHVIGVRRKKYMYYQILADLEEKMQQTVNPTMLSNYESKRAEILNVLLPASENTVTVSLVKNKRPPCRLIDDLDFLLDPNTGRLLREKRDEDDLVRHWEQMELTTPLDMIRQRVV